MAIIIVLQRIYPLVLGARVEEMLENPQLDNYQGFSKVQI